MCLKVGAERCQTFLFPSPPRRALFCCSCAATCVSVSGGERSSGWLVGVRSQVGSADGSLTLQDPGGLRRRRSTAALPSEGLVRLDTERVNGCCTRASTLSVTLYSPWNIPGYLSVHGERQQRLSELDWKKEKRRREAGLFMLDLIGARSCFEIGCENCTECLGNNKISEKGQNSQGKVLIMGFHGIYSSPVSISSAEAVMESVQNSQMTQASLPPGLRLYIKKGGGWGGISSPGTLKA